MKNLIYYMLTILIINCGGLEDKEKSELERLKAEEESRNELKERETKEADEQAALEETRRLDGSAVFLRGYLSAGFNITVDGESFEDAEDFYTNEYEKLEAEKNEDGYADYELTLAGKLGLTDLKYGMSVYVESVGEDGFGSETVIVADGTFELQFPSEANGETFQVRANKRVGVILRNPEGDTVHWCYNFYAKKETMVDRASKPIILRTFFTKITKYECKLSGGGKTQDDTISIPVSNVVPKDKAATEAQIDQWDAEWDEQVQEQREDGNPTQDQIDQWDAEWDALIEQQNNES